MKARIIKTAVGIICAAGLLAAASAKADSITFDLTAGNTALNGYSGPFASVTVDLTSSTTATISFASKTVGGNIYLMGDGGTADVNVNGAYTLGATVTEANAGTGFTPTFKENMPGQVDGWGNFNLSLNNNDGFGDSADHVSFTLTKSSGTWASAGDVLTPNLDGHIAAAHIFVTTSPAYATNSALVTGYASTPDGGATIALLGLGLFGIGSLRGRFSRK
jgi:hypothetical protein